MQQMMAEVPPAQFPQEGVATPSGGGPGGLDPAHGLPDLARRDLAEMQVG
jgi:hypothetical protein